MTAPAHPDPRTGYVSAPVGIFRRISAAAIPARIYFITAAMAAVAAGGMTIAAATVAAHVPAAMADEMLRIAQTFRAMPLWLLLGGAMAQVAGVINAAIDDARRHRGVEPADDILAGARCPDCGGPISRTPGRPWDCAHCTGGAHGR